MEILGLILKWGSLWLLGNAVFYIGWRLWRGDKHWCRCDICARAAVTGETGLPIEWGPVWDYDGEIWGIACDRCWDNGNVQHLLTYLNGENDDEED